MAEHQGGGVVVMSPSWNHSSEKDWWMRSVAGALSRRWPIAVITPSSADGPVVDGAFDVYGLQGAHRLNRPAKGGIVASQAFSDVRAVLVHGGDRWATHRAQSFTPGSPLVSLASVPADVAPTHSVLVTSERAKAAVVESGTIDSARVHSVGFRAQVNFLASEQPHSGLPVSDYILVLTDRSGSLSVRLPALTPMAAWIAARFPTTSLVVVENGRATTWLSRSRSTTVSIGTRMDLWRLMAHAIVTVDLQPGSPVAREAAESLAFGTPIIVPAGSSGWELAEAGGGLWYGDPVDLLGAIELLTDRGIRQAISVQALALAENWTGTADGFVDRTIRALESAISP